MKKTHSVIIISLNLIIILSFWWMSSGQALFVSPSVMAISLGRLAGLLAVLGILLQFSLLGRLPWIEGVFGLDKLTRFHRINAYATITAIIAHPLLLSIGYSALSQKGLLESYMLMATSDPTLQQAAAAVFLFIIVVFTSVYIARKHLKYEWWHTIHLLTYLAIVLAWGHQLKFGEDFSHNNLFVLYWYLLYALVFGSFLFFRILKPWIMFNYHRFCIKEVVKENDQVTSIIITGNNLEEFAIRAGQFVIVRFLDKQRWLEAHPFSVSQLPIKGHFRLTIKAVGDFTQQLNGLTIGTHILIEGPYGVFTTQKASKDKILMVAGGIGITPICTLLKELAASQKDIVLLYANRFANDILFEDELKKQVQKHAVTIYHILSQEKKTPHIKGRLDENTLTSLVPDLVKRDIYLCGSPPMMKSVREILKKLQVPASQIHFEEFSL